MLLGKRPRPPMRRTTSMTEFAADLGEEESTPPSDQETAHQQQRERQRAPATAEGAGGEMSLGPGWMDSRYAAAGIPSPRGGARRISGDFTVMETAAFLRVCGLCQRLLGPGRDIFIYRGEIAFCSLECRQQHISLDERKEKCLMTSVKKDAPPAATTVGSEASGSGETVAAA